MGVFSRRFFYWFILLVSFVQVTNASYYYSQDKITGQNLTCRENPDTGEHFYSLDSFKSINSSVDFVKYHTSYSPQQYSAFMAMDSSGNQLFNKSSNDLYLFYVADGNCFSAGFDKTIASKDAVANPDQPQFTPYTEEQCQHFGGIIGDVSPKTHYTPPDLTCYKGCVSQNKLFGDSWSVGSHTFVESEFTGGTCESIQPEEKEGCFEYQDNYLNWHQVCTIDPDVHAEEPEYPQGGQDPQDCMNVFDTNGDIVTQLCDPDPEKEGQCWMDSGQIYCGGFSAEGYSCIKINGVESCSYTGENSGLIDPDSVDHPANGGNGDGDLTNDVFEPDGSGNVAGGGYGHGGAGTFTQDSPSASDKLLAKDIGDAVSESLANEIGSGDMSNSYSTTGDFEATTQGIGTGLISAVQGTQVVQMKEQLVAAFSNKSGSCPSFSFDIDFLNIGNVGTDLHCQLVTDFAAVLRSIMMLIYIVLFIRIVLDA